MNGPAALAIAGGAIWALALVLWLHAGFRDRRVEAASEALPTDDIDAPVDYWPTTPAEDDPGWARHCRQAENLANSWSAVDELQFRRELRKHHPTTN